MFREFLMMDMHGGGKEVKDTLWAPLLAVGVEL